MSKRLKTLIKTGTAVVLCASIIFSYVNTEMIVNAESKVESEYTGYDKIISIIQEMLHNQSKIEALENLVSCLDEEEREIVLSIYNSYAGNSELYNTVCNLLENGDFEYLDIQIKENITPWEYESLLSIYENHTEEIDSFINAYTGSIFKNVLSKTQKGISFNFFFNCG